MVISTRWEECLHHRRIGGAASAGACAGCGGHHVPCTSTYVARESPEQARHRTRFQRSAHSACAFSCAHTPRAPMCREFPGRASLTFREGPSRKCTAERARRGAGRRQCCGLTVCAVCFRRQNPTAPCLDEHGARHPGGRYAFRAAVSCAAVARSRGPDRGRGREGAVAVWREGGSCGEGRRVNCVIKRVGRRRGKKKRKRRTCRGSGEEEGGAGCSRQG